MSLQENLKNNFILKGIDEDIIEKLIEEYQKVKQQSLLSDVMKVVLHSSRFSDLVLALIKNLLDNTQIDINAIRTEQLINELERRPKASPEDVILSLAIPRVIRSIHTIRNKKDVAHVKAIVPDDFDIFYCVSGSDWIMAQLISLLYTTNTDEAKSIIDSIFEKKVPWIEEFEDESAMLLAKGITIGQSIELILYHYHPKRIKEEKLLQTMQYDDVAYLRRILEILRRNKKIHINNDGIRLTRLGIRDAEEILVKL